MRLLLIVLISGITIQATPQKKQHAVVKNIEKRDRYHHHKKITKTESIEEYESDGSESPKKNTASKKAKKVITAILTFGLSLLVGSCK